MSEFSESERRYWEARIAELREIYSRRPPRNEVSGITTELLGEINVYDA